MTVAELILKLSCMPQDMLVVRPAKDYMRSFTEIGPSINWCIDVRQPKDATYKDTWYETSNNDREDQVYKEALVLV